MDNRYGRRKISKMFAEWNTLRSLIRSEGTESIQEAFDHVEEWSEYLFSKTEGNKS